MIKEKGARIHNQVRELTFHPFDGCDRSRFLPSRH